MPTGLQCFHLPSSQGSGGHRYCLLHTPPAGRIRAAVVYVHPFAEELNKTRRMAARTARALADSGCAVLQMDLVGCGDSSGEFSDASWGDWIDDTHTGVRWLLERYAAPLWLWGLRAGCLLALDAASALPVPTQFLFWQPPSSGRQMLQQFLRLKLTSGLGANRDPRSDKPREQIESGRSVEVAGYGLSPSLALGLERASLDPPARPSTSVWLEVSTRDALSPLPATHEAASRWRQSGHSVQLEVVRGPAFWQTQEIEDAPELLDATVRALAPSAVALDGRTPT